MDTITLTGIEVWAFHGVLAHEAEIGQRFVVDVTVHLDLTGAAAADDLAETVDYGALAGTVVDAASAPRAALLEVVVERVAAAVLDHDTAITAVDVTVHKPNAPMTVPVADVAVRIHRRREPAA